MWGLFLFEIMSFSLLIFNPKFLIMTLKNRIYKWISSNSRSQSEGVAIYKELGIKEPIPRFGQDDFLFSKIRSSYRDLINPGKKKITHKEVSRKKVYEKPKEEKVKEKNLVELAEEDAKNWYKRFMDARAMLFKSISKTAVVGENETINLLNREIEVLRLMKLHDKMHKKYDDVKFVEKYGRLPAKKNEVILDFIDEIDIYRQINNANKYISNMRMKEKREGLTLKQEIRLNERIALREKLIAKYEQLKNKL